MGLKKKIVMPLKKALIHFMIALLHYYNALAIQEKKENFLTF